MVELAPGGVFERLGLRRGDVIGTINGMDVVSTDQAQAMLRGALCAGPYVRVYLERAGVGTVLRYELDGRPLVGDCPPVEPLRRQPPEPEPAVRRVPRALFLLAWAEAPPRVIPHYRNDQFEGLKLVGVRRGSVASLVGLRSGDVIVKLNGAPLRGDRRGGSVSNHDDLLAWWATVGETAEVIVRRRGKDVSLPYVLE